MLKFNKNNVEVYYSKDIKTNASHFIDLFLNFFGNIKKIEIEPNKRYVFKIKFKTANVTFYNTKKKSTNTNYFLAENIRYKILRRKGYYQVVDKLKEKKLKLKNDTKLMLKNSNEIIKDLKNKPTLLANGKEALNTLRVIKNIENKI